MADPTYGPKVYIKQGGDELVVASGGVINIETGGVVKANGTQAAALTAQLTTITIADAAGTPDYALQALTTSSPYGLATAAEAITLLYVVKNLQTRMAEMEAIMEAAGLVIAN
jgi:hypothetical protein